MLSLCVFWSRKKSLFLHGYSKRQKATYWFLHHCPFVSVHSCFSKGKMIWILRNQSSSSHWCKRWTPKSSISDILLVLDLLHRKWNNSDSGVDWQILVLHMLTVQASFHLNLMNCIYSNIKALRGKIWQALEIIAINTSRMYSSEWVHMMFDGEYHFQHCRI